MTGEGGVASDLQYVLLGIPPEELKAWVEKQGLSKPANQVEAVFAAAQQPWEVVRPLYESNLLSGRKGAVTWFKQVRRPDFEVLRNALPVGAPSGNEPLTRFGLVWAREVSDGVRAIRLVYKESERLVREGLAYRRVAQFGVATALWRPDANQEEPQDQEADSGEDGDQYANQIFEVHCRSLQIPGVLDMLGAVTPAGDQPPHVLDIRSNACTDAIRTRLDGILTDAVVFMDDPSGPDDRLVFYAKPDRDLSTPESKFAEYQALPGRGRAIEYTEGSRRVRMLISQRDYSIVFARLNRTDCDRVFGEACQVGEWVPYAGT